MGGCHTLRASNHCEWGALVVFAVTAVVATDDLNWNERSSSWAGDDFSAAIVMSEANAPRNTETPCLLRIADILRIRLHHQKWQGGVRGDEDVLVGGLEEVDVLVAGVVAMLGYLADSPDFRVAHFLGRCVQAHVVELRFNLVPRCRVGVRAADDEDCIGADQVVCGRKSNGFVVSLSLCNREGKGECQGNEDFHGRYLPRTPFASKAEEERFATLHQNLPNVKVLTQKSYPCKLKYATNITIKILKTRVTGPVPHPSPPRAVETLAQSENEAPSGRVTI